MALLAQDRTRLAKMTHVLSKRVADKKASKQLQSITNKLTHSNPLTPGDTALLSQALQALLAAPVPVPPVQIALKDLLLVIPALRKLALRFLLRLKARSARRVYRDILGRL